MVAAKSLQSCPTLCDPIDGSLPGSPIPGILQARTLEWVAISFSNAWKYKVKVKSLSRVWLIATAWTAAYQAPPSMGFYCTFNFKMLANTFYVMKIHKDACIFKYVSDIFEVIYSIMVLLEFPWLIPEKSFKKLSSCINVLYYSFIFVCTFYIL